MCSCDHDWDTMPSFYKEETRTARKVHKCSECYCACIQPGDKYRVVSGLWEGKFEEFKTCAACDEIADFMKDNAECFCPSLGDLYSMAHDEIHELRGIPGVQFGFGRLMVARQRRQRFYGLQTAPITTRKS